MGLNLRFPVTILVLLCGLLPMREACSAPALERGTAITDPLVLRELDSGRFGLGRVMLPVRSANMPLMNNQLFALPALVPLRKALDAEFDQYIRRHKAGLLFGSFA